MVKMEKILTLHIPVNVYEKIKYLVKTENKRMEDVLLEAVEDSLKRKLERINDSFFQITATKGSGLHDVAEKHDKYLYERD